MSHLLLFLSFCGLEKKHRHALLREPSKKGNLAMLEFASVLCAFFERKKKTGVSMCCVSSMLENGGVLWSILCLHIKEIDNSAYGIRHIMW